MGFTPLRVMFCAGVILFCAGCAGCAGVDRGGAHSETVAGSVLLQQARTLTAEEGLPKARDYVLRGLREEDASRGSLERRVILATRNPRRILPDSLAAMPPSRRARVAVVIVPGTKSGFGSKSYLTGECLQSAADKCLEMGFATYFVRTQPRGTVEENAKIVANQIRPAFGQSDKVILLMLSKGAHDVIYYLLHHADDLSPGERRKLVGVLSLAGTVQGSVVADWFARSPRPLAGLTRAYLRLSGQNRSLSMLHTVGSDPWRTGAGQNLHRMYPNLTWVSVAMVPDGADGSITQRLWAPGIRRAIQKSSPYYSPNDGLVETAASVLPDGVMVREWIVAAYGSHAMPNGRYLDGTRIAPGTTAEGQEELSPASGGEVMSAYLRALPQSLLAGGGSARRGSGN